tara:strand:- start:24 stop:389 length:366 start_codon:yes stop_codon:yes gene_type:complete
MVYTHQETKKITMKKIKLTEKDLTKIIQRVINEQEDTYTNPREYDRNRSKFLEAYRDMSSHIYNVFYMDKQDISSHDADKIILGFKKTEHEMEEEMDKACRKYEEVKRYFSRYKDDWIWNE